MKTLFITASGTGIGKTYVTAALIRQLRDRDRTVRALKPVISDYSPATAATSDTAMIIKAMGKTATPALVEAISPWRFKAPLSPDMAAARENRTIDYAALLDFCHTARRGPEDWLLIEGVGGVMVPLTRERTVLDWIAALEVPSLLVVGSYLGTISHTLTALSALQGRNVHVPAIVVSETPDSGVPLAETRNAIARFAGTVPVVNLPRDASLSGLLDLLAGTDQTTSTARS